MSSRQELLEYYAQHEQLQRPEPHQQLQPPKPRQLQVKICKTRVKDNKAHKFNGAIGHLKKTYR